MNEKLVITGGIPLKGKVCASGAKNAAVAILPASIICDEICTVENLPDILDVKVMQNILTLLGAKTQYKNCKMTINPKDMISRPANYELLRYMRASYYLLGALLAKFGKAEIALPGGCDIGQRPIDQHIKGLESLGAEIELRHGLVKASAKGGRLTGGEVYLDVVSVGATANIMLAAVKAKGQTVIVNAAKEPHIVDLANFLNTMGAKIKGAGTDAIRITGVDYLHGCNYSIIPDQIEVGTLMISAAATHGDVTISNVIPLHMDALSAKLIEMGVDVEAGEDSIRVACDKRPNKVTIMTLPYPGFPTDLQQPMSSLLCVASGTSMVIENIFEDRFKHLNYLQRMGAKASVSGRVAVIEGVDKLTGAPVAASDLRAGAALVVAGLMAEGETTISNVWHIDRGYDHIEEKLKTLGARIQRIPEVK